MKLGVHVGYWGLGMGPQDQLAVVREAARPGDDSVNAFVCDDLELARTLIPPELIDLVSLCGPRDAVSDRMAAFRDAGVGTLMTTPMAFSAVDRIDQPHAIAELAA